jgi:hypothetical protein
MDQLADKVLAGTMINEVSGLSATGVPPHILLANEISNLRQEITQKVSTMEENLGGAIDQLPERVKQAVLDNFQVDGSIPITHGQINDMVISLRNELLTAIDGRGHNNDPNP